MQLAGRVSVITSQSFHFENAVESRFLGTISAAFLHGVSYAKE
jgi:hypothetical protein